MSHPLHSKLMSLGFRHKLDNGVHEYVHPSLPRFWTHIADYDSHGGRKAAEYAIDKAVALLGWEKTKGHRQ